MLLPGCGSDWAVTWSRSEKALVSVSRVAFVDWVGCEPNLWSKAEGPRLRPASAPAVWTGVAIKTWSLRPGGGSQVGHSPGL